MPSSEISSRCPVRVCFLVVGQTSSHDGSPGGNGPEAILLSCRPLLTLFPWAIRDQGQRRQRHVG